jgi:hypothetical protein
MTHVEYLAEYGAMRAAAVSVKGELLDRLIAVCQTNEWLKVGGIDFEPEGFCPESDYPYTLERFDDVEMLERFFAHGNWAIRTAVQYRDLIFVNQVNGGDEWWTLKVLPEGNLLPFESITMRSLIRDDEFATYVNRLLKATPEQCRSLDY